MTDNVCDKQLNSEYRNLARAMTGAPCRNRPPQLPEWLCRKRSASGNDAGISADGSPVR